MNCDHNKKLIDRGCRTALSGIVTAVFVLALSGCSDGEVEPSAGAASVDAGGAVTCAEPLPRFAVDRDMYSADQATDLCRCVWATLGDWQRQAAEDIRNQRPPSGPADADQNLADFTMYMAQALRSCRGQADA